MELSKYQVLLVIIQGIFNCIVTVHISILIFIVKIIVIYVSDTIILDYRNLQQSSDRKIALKPKGPLLIRRELGAQGPILIRKGKDYLFLLQINSDGFNDFLNMISNTTLLIHQKYTFQFN